MRALVFGIKQQMKTERTKKMLGSLLLTKKIELFEKNENCSSKVFTLNKITHSDKGQSMERSQKMKKRNNSDDEELILSNNLCYGDYIDLCFDWFGLPVFFVSFFQVNLLLVLRLHELKLQPKTLYRNRECFRSRIRMKNVKKKKTVCITNTRERAHANGNIANFHALMRLPDYYISLITSHSNFGSGNLCKIRSEN